MSKRLTESQSAPEWGSARQPRLGRFIGVTLERTGHETEKAIVSNISSRGMGGKCAIALEPGERVMAHLPLGVRLGAIVRWCERGRFGLMLDREIDPETVRFSEEAWAETRAAQPVQDFGFEAFRPVSSTKRPGFRVR
jgi:PilZ domain